ncbi:MAG: hypothetical protein OCD76_19470 [Reichenbachiella sp.]
MPTNITKMYIRTFVLSYIKSTALVIQLGICIILFFSTSIQAQVKKEPISPNHRVFIINKPDIKPPAFRFDFKEEGELRVYQLGYHMYTVKFQGTKMYSFEKWQDSPGVVFCAKGNDLEIYLVLKEDAPTFDCDGVIIEALIL